MHALRALWRFCMDDCLWRLSHDESGVYAKADRRVEPDLMGDDGRQTVQCQRGGVRAYSLSIQ